jgi:hypothetical protein
VTLLLFKPNKDSWAARLYQFSIRNTLGVPFLMFSCIPRIFFVLWKNCELCAYRFNDPLHHPASDSIKAKVFFPTMACSGGNNHASIGNVYERDDTTCDEQLMTHLQCLKE